MVLSRLWPTQFSASNVRFRLDLIERFLATKIGIFYIFRLGDFSLNWLIICLLIPAVGLVLSKHPFRIWALLGISLLITYRIVSNLPYTINHRVFESLVIWMITIRAFARQGNPSSVLRARLDRETFGFLIFAFLSVYFYSGIQKLVHGYYLNGEFFALYLALDPGEIGSILRWTSQTIGTTAKVVDFPFHSPFHSQDYELGPTLPFLLPFLGTSVILLECLVPFLAWLRPKAGVYCLLCLQLLIAGASGEWDFGLTGLGIIFLLLPRSPNWKLYALLLGIHTFNAIVD